MRPRAYGLVRDSGLRLMPNSSVSEVSIRDARPGDAPRLYEIDQICFAPYIAYSRAEILFLLTRRSSIARVAELSGDAAGFVIGQAGPGVESHVITLDVIPEARRRKIGTLLMSALHEEFRRRGIERVILEVDTTNETAQQFYRGFGYERGELLHGYYQGRSDAYRMRLRL